MFYKILSPITIPKCWCKGYGRLTVLDCIVITSKVLNKVSQFFLLFISELLLFLSSSSSTKKIPTFLEASLSLLYFLLFGQKLEKQSSQPYFCVFLFYPSPFSFLLLLENLLPYFWLLSFLLFHLRNLPSYDVVLNFKGQTNLFGSNDNSPFHVFYSTLPSHVCV